MRVVRFHFVERLEAAFGNGGAKFRIRRGGEREFCGTVLYLMISTQTAGVVRGVQTISGVRIQDLPFVHYLARDDLERLPFLNAVFGSGRL